MAIVQERREVAGFDEVVLEGSGTITLTQGEQEGLVIEADESLLPHLKSEVSEGRLRLGLRNWWDYLIHIGHPQIHYQVSMREVHGIAISGSGKLQAGRIETDRMRLKISGSGDMTVAELHAGDLEISFSGTGKTTVTGAVEKQSIHISGSGEVRAEDLACGEVRVSISGSGTVRVRAASRLDVHISGSGNIGFVGQPNVTQSISGSGKVWQVRPE